jgi:hypothetical protein
METVVKSPDSAKSRRGAFFLSPPPVRPPALATAFAPKANSQQPAQLGDTFDPLDVGAFAGNFDSIPARASGNAWDFSARKTTGSVTVVPQSDSALLLLAGLSFLDFRRRR